MTELAHHLVRTDSAAGPRGNILQPIERRGHAATGKRRRFDEAPGLGVRRQQRPDFDSQCRVVLGDRRQEWPALGCRPLDRLLQHLLYPLPAFRGH